MTLRTVAAFESEGNFAPYRVTAPTKLQFERMQDRLVHGENEFCDRYPELAGDYDLDSLLTEHPSALNVLSFEHDKYALAVSVGNIINEHLAGPKLSARDLTAVKSNADLWFERDHKYLDLVTISEQGCWELPKYIDHIKPNRARCPQPRVYSREHDDVRQQMGSAWMWDRVIGPLPDDKLPNGRRAFWPDHRCNNKACVYPRHVALGRPEANDAFTARMDMMEFYETWTSNQWARPSFGYPDGISDIVHESEVQVLSDRSVILPLAMSRRELEASVRELAGAPHLPDGGWTTDPGYHVLFGALKRGVDFDDVSGCWNARFDLNLLSPHKKTITHACGNQNCCNIRHMDIADEQKKYYLIQDGSFVTLPDGRLVNTETGEYLPPYWESWSLYWNWLKKYSGVPTPEQEVELEDEPDFEVLLSEVDFLHLWVHPLTGCWENERFYPRWSANGNQQNAYGFHRSGYGEFGRSTHRYLLYKYLESTGVTELPDLSMDADHRCNNRRCCNPLHMQFTGKDAHRKLTNDRIKHDDSLIRQRVARNFKLRYLGVRKR